MTTTQTTLDEHLTTTQEILEKRELLTIQQFGSEYQSARVFDYYQVGPRIKIVPSDQQGRNNNI